MRAAASVKQNPAGMENRNILKHQSFNNYFLFSSRFTDSSKYEDQFQNCFKLEEERVGEICNACVLLVKRWKKLPKNTKRDWSHVVDARAGKIVKGVVLDRFTV